MSAKVDRDPEMQELRKTPEFWRGFVKVVLWESGYRKCTMCGEYSKRVHRKCKAEYMRLYRELGQMGIKRGRPKAKPLTKFRFHYSPDIKNSPQDYILGTCKH